MDVGSEPQEFGAVPNTSWGAFKPCKVCPVTTDLFYHICWGTSYPNPNHFGSFQWSQILTKRV